MLVFERISPFRPVSVARLFLFALPANAAAMEYECDALESLMTGTIDVSSRDEQIQREAASLKFMNLHMVHSSIVELEMLM